jgi:hypothetical protein
MYIKVRVCRSFSIWLSPFCAAHLASVLPPSHSVHAYLCTPIPSHSLHAHLASVLPRPHSLHAHLASANLCDAYLASVPGAFKSGVQGVYSMNLEYIKCSLIPAEYS